MKNLKDFPEIADGLCIGSLTYFLNNKWKIQTKTRVIYIAPASYLKSVNIILPDVEILPFNGGFKQDSVILFSLDTENDIKYFNKITGYTIGKNGELISHTKTNLQEPIKGV